MEFVHGAAALAVMNTATGTGDLLDDRWVVAAMANWGIQMDSTVMAADVAELRRLRDMLLRLTNVVTSGKRLTAAQLRPLNNVLEQCPVLVKIVPDGDSYALSMTPTASDWLTIALREVAGSFSGMLRADPARLRICAAPDCATVFWDDTRSRTRTWCDPRRCGNRARVRRHRAATPGEA